jgi:Uma2 family endonuclease
MAGGTLEHAALAAAVVTRLGLALEGGRCRICSSALRIRVLATGLTTYPDVSVICGPRQVDPEDKNSITNPILLVEVTSESTEQYDRGEKFEHFQRIPSLREYVLVSHAGRTIEVRRCEADGSWTSHVAHAGERAELTSAECMLDVDGLYDASIDPTE